MMKLTCSDGFVSELSTETVDNVTFVTITAKAKEKDLYKKGITIKSEKTTDIP
jgi:hypothetical protein